MNDMNTPNPAEQQPPGARFELDVTLLDIYLCAANCPPYRPEIKSGIERCSGRIVWLAVEKPAEAD